MNNSYMQPLILILEPDAIKFGELFILGNRFLTHLHGVVYTLGNRGTP